MSKLVADEHPDLYHYTTAEGLKGIISSQQLWATHIEYLNDVEEHIGFFTRRLPDLLDKPVREALAEAMKKPAIPIPDDFDKEGAVQEDKNVLCKMIRDHTLAFNNPYVSSFCGVSSPEAARDGLLSQWRGYGSDGGYAIVFETKGLDLLLAAENKTFGYQFGGWGNANYHLAPPDPEIVELESRIQKTVYEAIRAGQDSPSDAYDPLYVPLTYLACAYKHSGFSLSFATGAPGRARFL